MALYRLKLPHHRKEQTMLQCLVFQHSNHPRLTPNVWWDISKSKSVWGAIGATYQKFIFLPCRQVTEARWKFCISCCVMLSGPDSLAVCDLFPRCRNRIEHTPLHVVDCCWLALLRGSDVENNTVSSVLLPITCLALHRHHVQQSKQEDQLLHSRYIVQAKFYFCPIQYGESQAQLFSCSRLGCLSVDW